MLIPILLLIHLCITRYLPRVLDQFSCNPLSMRKICLQTPSTRRLRGPMRSIVAVPKCYLHSKSKFYPRFVRTLSCWIMRIQTDLKRQNRSLGKRVLARSWYLLESLQSMQIWHIFLSLAFQRHNQRPLEQNRLCKWVSKPGTVLPLDYNWSWPVTCHRDQESFRLRRCSYIRVCWLNREVQQQTQRSEFEDTPRGL